MSGLDFQLLQRLYERTGGKTWDPPDPYHSLFEPYLSAGLLCRADLQTEHVRIPDYFMTWTDDAHAFIQAMAPHPLKAAAS